jgi:glycosyltransferase involved in cell wall biosynthesis
MKVQVIYARNTFELLSRQSALGSYIHCFCTILQKNGYEIYVNDVSFSELNQYKKNEIRNPDGSGKGLSRFIPFFLKEALKDLILFRNLDLLYEKIRKVENVQCIIEFYTYGSDIGMRLKRERSVPLIMVFDSPAFEEYKFFHEKKIFFNRKIINRENNSLKEASSIVVYSPFMAKYVSGITSKQDNIYIHQNVDFTRFEFINVKVKSDPLNIVFIGSFLKWHKVDSLVRCFERLKKNEVNARLTLIGNGLEFQNIKNMVQESPFENAIELTGFLDGEKLLHYKKQAHIGVVAGANWYCAPNKIFEYGVAGMAVVAADTPTISFLSENLSGLVLFKQSSEDDLYKQLEKLCLDKNYRNKQAFDLQNQIKNSYSEHNTFDFYNNLISKNTKK